MMNSPYNAAIPHFATVLQVSQASTDAAAAIKKHSDPGAWTLPAPPAPTADSESKLPGEEKPFAGGSPGGGGVGGGGEDESGGVSSVQYKASGDDKATISISLPSSILKDKKHFQNVIETINNTLLKSSTGMVN